jgi:hypothetical protein
MIIGHNHYNKKHLIWKNGLRKVIRFGKSNNDHSCSKLNLKTDRIFRFCILNSTSYKMQEQLDKQKCILRTFNLCLFRG